MPRVNVDIPHRLSREEARTRIMAATPQLEKEYSATCRWDGETRLIVTRKGLKAALDVEETHVRVALELGLLLGPLGGSIRAGIVRQLTGLLA
ncbi:MAG: polyhydroxyalkanoic acid system family protein [Polyangia bacterium]|jgi:putative polyhydroxyalkanoate system protein